MYRRFIGTHARFVTILAGLWLLAAPALGVEVFLRADVTTLTLPDGANVAMWGFAQDSAFGAMDGTVAIPGPTISVPPGETTLTIHVDNNLTQAATNQDGGTSVSLVIPGQITAMTPVRFGAAPYPQYEGRIRSLTYETPPGNAAPVDYAWSNLKPGTFVYESATHMQCHVQMGLYGAAIVYAPGGEAYPGVAFDNEAVLLYSEIDPVFHAAVASGNYGPGKAMTSPIDYDAKYFLINGQPFSGNPLDPGAAPILDHPLIAGENVLFRFLNLGLETHAPMSPQIYLRVVAEDGNPYPYPKEEYALNLTAGKTLDALWTAQSGLFPIVDRRFDLTNGAQSPGGMLAYLVVPAGPSVNHPPAPTAPAISTPKNLAATSQVAHNDPDAGDTHTYDVTTTPTNGIAGVDAAGLVTYTPNADYEGTDTLTVTVTDQLTSSGEVVIPVTVANTPPVANPDAYETPYETALVVAAPGVLENDSDASSDPLTALLVQDVAHGTLTLDTSGSLTYTPTAGFWGGDFFTYVANDGTDNSSLTTVTLTVPSPNTPPVANPDLYATTQNTTLTVTAPGILTNDTDFDSDPLAAVLVHDVAHGTLALDPAGSFTYTPSPFFYGADSFTYVANDGIANSNVTTVTLSVALDPALSGWWKLDEGAGAIAVDSAGFDSTGTLTNGPTWTTGQWCGALQFDGANDYVDVGDSTFGLSSQLTVACWVHLGSTPTSSRSVFARSDSVRPFRIRTVANTTRIRAGIRTPNGTFYLNSPNMGTGWHHVVMTYRTGALVVYIDGVQKASSASPRGNLRGINVAGTTTRLGGDSGGAYFPGRIDDARIYNRALTAAEVAQLFAWGGN